MINDTPTQAGPTKEDSVEMQSDLRTSLELAFRTVKRLQKHTTDTHLYTAYDDVLRHVVMARTQLASTEGGNNG